MQGTARRMRRRPRRSRILRRGRHHENGLLGASAALHVRRYVSDIANREVFIVPCGLILMTVRSGTTDRHRQPGTWIDAHGPGHEITNHVAVTDEQFATLVVPAGWKYLRNA